MELESYFDFLGENHIRIKGHRIDLEHVLHQYLQGATPEEIVYQLPTLNLEKVYAAVLYYLANREKVEAYLQRVAAEEAAAYQDYLSKPDPKRDELRERLNKARERLQAEGKLIAVGKTE